MKYIKSKYLNTDGELHSFNKPYEIECLWYDRIDGWDYFGIDVEDVTELLQSQNPLIEAVEVTFIDIQDILKGCRMYNEINQRTVNNIRAKYDINAELANMKLDKDDPVYIAMIDHIQACRQEGTNIKKQYGLKQ